MRRDVTKFSNWWAEINREHKLWEKRTKRGFLILPVVINKELRWLEKAKWEEEWGLEDNWWNFAGDFMNWTKTKWLN